MAKSTHSNLLLIPTPKFVHLTKGTLTLPDTLYILLDPHPAARHILAAERLALELGALAGASARVAVSTSSVTPAAELRTHFDPAIPHDQGYRLTIAAGKKGGIDLYARTPAGMFYAFQTLTQIIRQVGYATRQPPLKLPCLTIEDHPDFARRGVYHDCARGKVPTLETLLQLVDDLAGLKINEFQLYVENAFEFRQHPEMFDDTTPLTAEDILLLDAACRARHIDFVPSLTSLGHFDKILRRPAFRHLAEAEPDDLRQRGENVWFNDPWTLCVTDPGAWQLLKDMYDEFLPNFSSDTFNICCDESWDLGKGRTRELAAQIGVGKMYVDWVRYCNSLAKSHGRRIQMWGDIILNHADLISQLPEDATLLEWGYEWGHNFDEHGQTFADRLRLGALGSHGAQSKMKDEKSKIASRSFYVCPGTSSWIALAGRSRNAFGNIFSAATAGLKHGATGLLNTDWGDNGHQQFLAISLLPFAYGAAASWNLAAVPNPAPQAAPDWSTGRVPPAPPQADRALEPLLEAVSLHVFRDPSRQFAALAYDLGLTYERFSWQRFNGTLEWYLFREKWDFANYVNRALPRDLAKVIAACEKLLPDLECAPLLRPDSAIITAEFALTCREIIHTCQRTQLRQAWLAADPAQRNPEHEVLRAKAPQPLPRTFNKNMKTLAADAAQLHKQFRALWLARNTKSRLADIDVEFDRLKAEYRKFAAKA